MRGREGGREGGGGGRRGADTELKTKTPHVNVGNNIISDFRSPQWDPMGTMGKSLLNRSCLKPQNIPLPIYNDKTVYTRL